MFLFSDVLIYGKKTSQEGKAKIEIAKNGQIALLQMKVIDVGSPGNENAFQIQGPGKSFLVFAATKEEKTEWLSSVKQTLNLRKSPRILRILIFLLHFDFLNEWFFFSILFLFF